MQALGECSRLGVLSEHKSEQSGRRWEPAPAPGSHPGRPSALAQVLVLVPPEVRPAVVLPCTAAQPPRQVHQGLNSPRPYASTWQPGRVRILLGIVD